jgi:hypothetical protein
MPRLDQDNKVHEFTFEGKEYRAEYMWALNSISIEEKTASGRWKQINANTQKAFDMIRQEKLTWGDYRAFKPESAAGLNL